MKISGRQPKISDSLKISDYSNSMGVLQHPQAPPAFHQGYVVICLILSLTYSHFPTDVSFPLRTKFKSLSLSLQV